MCTFTWNACLQRYVKSFLQINVSDIRLSQTIEKKNPWEHESVTWQHTCMCSNRCEELSRRIGGIRRWRLFLHCSSCGNTTQHRRTIDRRFYGACNGRNDIFMQWFSGEKTIFFPDVQHGGFTLLDDSKKAPRLNKTKISHQMMDYKFKLYKETNCFQDNLTHIWSEQLSIYCSTKTSILFF